MCNFGGEGRRCIGVVCEVAWADRGVWKDLESGQEFCDHVGDQGFCSGFCCRSKFHGDTIVRRAPFHVFLTLFSVSYCSYCYTLSYSFSTRPAPQT